MYTFGGLIFSSKDKVRKYIGNLRNKYSFNQVLDADDFLFVCDVLKQHPRAKSKIGAGVASIRVIPGLYGSWAFQLVRVDGSTTDFSYRKCLTPLSIDRQVKEAARWEVQSQMSAFFYTWQRNTPAGERVCPFTGEKLSKTNQHVDHTPPATFDALLSEFLEDNGLRMKDVVIDRGDNRMRQQFKDRDLAVSWQEFHAQRARFRVISRWANLSIVPRQVHKKKP